MKRTALALLAIALSITPAFPRSRSTRCATCTRSKTGRIARSSTAKRQFEKSNRCPSTGRASGACPGYVVDHKKALAVGGKDAPENMQWQTSADAKAKDKTERK